MTATVHDITSIDDIRVPDELRDWAERHKPMISRLAQALNNKPVTNEQSLWEMLAAEYSPEWLKARESLLRAERQLDEVMNPMNRPLGLIGAALHSDETTHAERIHNICLTGFTVINENLRSEERLAKLLDALKDHAHTIHQSLELSRNAASMTAEFASVAAMEMEPVSASTDFGKIAGRPEEKPQRGGYLATSFRNLGAKLFGGPKKAVVIKTVKPEARF